MLQGSKASFTVTFNLKSCVKVLKYVVAYCFFCLSKTKHVDLIGVASGLYVGYI
jgi:hypothetical protein